MFIETADILCMLMSLTSLYLEKNVYLEVKCKSLQFLYLNLFCLNAFLWCCIDGTVLLSNWLPNSIQKLIHLFNP